MALSDRDDLQSDVMLALRKLLKQSTDNGEEKAHAFINCMTTKRNAASCSIAQHESLVCITCSLSVVFTLQTQ